MKRVLALDPGDSVGWARADVADDGTWSNLRHGITPLKQCALDVHDRLVDDLHCECGRYYEHATTKGCAPTCSYDTVVLERWALYATHAKVMIGSEIPSAQFIGMVKLSCWLAGVPCVMQPASRVNSNRPGVLAQAEATMRKFRPEMFELVSQPIAHDDGHDLVAIKHLWAWTTDNYPEVLHAQGKED